MSFFKVSSDIPSEISRLWLTRHTAITLHDLETKMLTL
jgi:hypothetical protein